MTVFITQTTKIGDETHCQVVDVIYKARWINGRVAHTPEQLRLRLSYECADRFAETKYEYMSPRAFVESDHFTWLSAAMQNKLIRKLATFPKKNVLIPERGYYRSSYVTITEEEFESGKD